MRMQHITIPEEVILLLSRVHFCNSHVYFDIAKRNSQPKGAYEALRAVARNTGFIDATTPRLDGKALGSVFYLTPKGAEAVAELHHHECPPVFAPGPEFRLGHVDYLHRMECAHVAAKFWQWADGCGDLEPILWRGYWQKNSAKLPLNSVHPEGLEKPMVPDWLLKYEHNGDAVLLALEVERTTGLAAMKRRLRNYAAALDQELIQKTANHPSAPVVAIVSSAPETLRKLVQDVQTGELGAHFLDLYRGNFILASSDDIKTKGWADSFYTLDGRKSSLFSN